jgi:hypothetical protein
MSKFHHGYLLHLTPFHLSNILFFNLLNLGTRFFQQGGEFVIAQNVNHDMEHTCASSLSSLHLIETIYFHNKFAILQICSILRK